MIEARKGWSILEYQSPDDYVDSSLGILLPSEATKRDTIKKKSQKILVAGDYMPDVMRVGTLLSGDIDVDPGASVLFNKHNAIEFKLDGKTYYSIRSENVEAVLT